MNSYPHEFLNHPQPLMFVAGLSSNAESSSSARARGASVSARIQPGGSRRGSASGDAHASPSKSILNPSSAAGSVGLDLNSPLTSPGPSSVPLPTSPPSGTTPEASTHQDVKARSTEHEFENAGAAHAGEVDQRDEEFDRLREDLRGALSGVRNTERIWQPRHESKEFKIVLVDKNTRLPLRKIANPSGGEQSVPHSPLSPLTPSSPLYPDGLIAPVWVRKHAEMVPSVFVLFLRLYESPRPPEGDSGTAEDKGAREKNERDKEQEMDDKLVGEIGERRRRLGERGIKLTVVLMASTETLDAPSLDSRLSYLRRASALSSKASLFVLTPVPADQLPDFVQSLQDALFDSAMDYYSNHSKRVRRKKARLPANQFGAVLGGDRGRALGSQGWAVRYDWKAGWFAEVRGDLDVARRHYEDCWNELARMFASTQTLPPRTKRWAEAKVLADCVAIRICRLILYEGGGAKVLGPFFVHLRRFGDLSRGWGIGEETFEFWSWIARQYRVFAELLDLAVQAGMQIAPAASPLSPLASPDLAMSPTLPEFPAPSKTAVNPLQTLQQPAFYFYMAATCTIHRRERFLEAQAAEDDALSSEAGAASGYVSTAPGYSNEKKVDHTELIIELFTKTYDLVKAQDPPQQSFAQFLASRMAETYCEAGKYDMAIQYFNDLSKSFKAGHWDPIVKDIRDQWYKSAQQTGDVESVARMLIEMMGPDSGVEKSEQSALQDDLLTILKTTTPAKDEPIVIEMSDETSLLNVQAGFWKSEAELSEIVPHQIALECPSEVDISSIEFAKLSIKLSGDQPSLEVTHDAENSNEASQFVKLQDSANNAKLQWTPGHLLVLNGEVTRDNATELEITNITLDLKVHGWDIQLVFKPTSSSEWRTPKGSFTPVHAITPRVHFISRPFAVEFDVSHHPSGFIDESFNIDMKLANNDSRDLQCKLSVFLQPEEEEDGSSIAVDDQKSSSLIEDIDLGRVAAGSSKTKAVMLLSPIASTKLVDVSVQLRELGDETDRLVEERTHTAAIPILPPFDFVPRLQTRSKPNDEVEVTVAGVLICPGPRVIHLDSMTFDKADTDWSLEASSLEHGDVPAGTAKLMKTSLTLPEWDQSKRYAIYTRFAKSSQRKAPPISPGHLTLSWRSDESGPSVSTKIPFPRISVPIIDDLLSATLYPPSQVDLQQPFLLPLTLTNHHRTTTPSALVEVSTAENFVWKGKRAVRLDLPPGDKRVLPMELIAVGLTGWCDLPKISIWEEREGEEGRYVKITDLRYPHPSGPGELSQMSLSLRPRVFVRP